MVTIKNEVRAILAGAAALASVGVAHADPLPLGSGGIAYYLSGSTAMDNGVKALLLQGTGGICNATPDVYIDSTAADITKAHNTLVVCKISEPLGSGASQVPSGTLVAFDKESNGGSLEGILPISQNIGLKFFTGLQTATAGTLGCTSSVTVPAGYSSTSPYTYAQQYVLHYGCTPPTTSSTAVPVVGFADENPESFNVGSPTVGSSDIGKIGYQQFVQNVFGIGVSLNMYRALQHAQGLTQNDALANTPTLSSNAIRSLFAGNVASWSGITDASGNAINALTNTGNVAVSNQVYLCRRGDSSGTNASVGIYFGLDNRCTSSSGGAQFGMAAGNTSVGNCKGYISAFGSATNLPTTEYGCSWQNASNSADTVFAGFGGGDVASCLSYHDTQNQFALGLLTTNQGMGDVGGTGGSADSSTSTNGRFRFVKIDGKAPDLGSVVNGTYDYVMDNIIVTAKTPTSDTSDLVKYLTNLYFTKAALVRDFMATQPTDSNFTAGVLIDQLNANNTFTPNSTPPYVTGSQVKAGTNGTTTINPVSPFTQLAINGSDPQDCGKAWMVANPGVPTNP